MGCGQLTRHSTTHHTHPRHRSGHASHRHATAHHAATHHRVHSAATSAATHVGSTSHAATHHTAPVEAAAKAAATAAHGVVEAHVIIKGIHVVALKVAVEASRVHATAAGAVKSTPAAAEAAAIVVVALEIGAAVLEARTGRCPVLPVLGSAVGGILRESAEGVDGRTRVDYRMSLLAWLAALTGG